MKPKKTRTGSAVLIIEDDKILLGKRNKEPGFGEWVLPGGKIEFGETHIQAARREAKEEVGLDIEIVRLAGKVLYYILRPDNHRIIIYSIARRVGGDIVPSSDISEAKFFTRAQLKELKLTSVVAEVLTDEGWI
jgi:8-oxo-dGTP diphosphatase